jgi:hypothetical protein
MWNTYSQYHVFAEDSATFLSEGCLSCPVNGVEDNKGQEKI